MHILFVTPTLPIPTSGGRTRLFNLVKQLGTRHKVSVISFIQPPEYELLAQVEPYCHHLELVPFAGFAPLGQWRNRLQGWSRILFSRRPRYVYTFPVESMRLPLRRLLSTQDFDVIVFHHLFVVELANEVEDTPSILAQDNVESDIERKLYLKATQPVHMLRDWLSWRKLLAFERRWVEHFPLCVAVSERDAAILSQMSVTTQVQVVPNGVDSQNFAPAGNLRQPETLLFFGTLSYGPNVEGLNWFCREILPRVRESKPNVELEVVGLNPPPEVTALGRLPGVCLIGFVPDIRTKLWSATLCVVPLHVGGGTRLKILEALAAGCPVISTTIGAEGLSLVDGEHLLIADAAEEFTEGVLTLLTANGLRQRLAEAGRQLVTEKYDWRQIAMELESACNCALELHHCGNRS